MQLGIKSRQITTPLFLWILLWFGGATMAHAQCPLLRDETLDGNHVAARVTNGGAQFMDHQTIAAYRVPANQPHSSLGATAIWVGGRDVDDSLRLAATTFNFMGGDFYPGPIRTGHPYACGRMLQFPGLKAVLNISGGRMLVVENDTAWVVNLGTQAQSAIAMPRGYPVVELLELTTGEVIIMGWGNFPTMYSEAVVVDPAALTVLRYDTLSVRHEFPRLTALPTGEVLTVSSIGTVGYFPQTGAEVVRSTMPLPRRRHGQALLPDGRLLVVGGVNLANTDIYDPIADSWSVGPTTQIMHGTGTLVATTAAGDIMVVGGSLVDSLVERYDAGSQSFVPVVRLPHNSAAQVVPTGPNEVLVSGFAAGDPRNGLLFLNTQSGAMRTVDFVHGNGHVAYAGAELVSGMGADGQLVWIDQASGRIRDARWDRIWKISRQQVAQFQSDFTNNAVNFANYPDLRDWPGNGNVWAGEDAQLAPYVDLDHDGQYDPAGDGDYPCFPGDQAVYRAYNDDGPHHESGGEPAGYQFQHLSWVVDCAASPCPDTTLGYATFHHMQITNHGTSDLHDVHVGLFMDAQIGLFSDDLIGSDSTLGMAFWYNRNDSDGVYPATGYGAAPPAAGTLLLPNGEIDSLTSTMYFRGDIMQDGPPVQPAHFYQYMQANWRDGSPLVNDGMLGWGISGNHPRVHHVFPGDAGFCGGQPTGWSEVSAGNTWIDRVVVMGMGPLDLAQGASVNLDYAILWARGNSNLGSVCQLKQAAGNVKNWWQNDLDRTCFSLVMPAEETVPSANGIHIFPNPSNGIFQLTFESAPPRASSIEVHDLQGRIILTQVLGAGSQSATLDLSGVARGIFVVSVGGRVAGKLVRID